MSDEVRQASIVLLESNPLVQTRVARILSASSGFAPVLVANDVIEMSEMMTPGVQLLVAPDLELDLAINLVEAREGVGLAIVNKEVTGRAMDAMDTYPSFCHLLSWPDFLAIPRPWDLAMAARFALAPDLGCSWQDILPACSASMEWNLYSSFDRDSVIEEISRIVGENLADERIADSVAEVAYEMAMNAMYDAPVDEFGRAKYGHDRQHDIALEDHEVPSLTFACDGSLLVLQVDDPFGRLKRSDVLEGIRRGSGARTADSSAEILNTRQGGAGLGIFRMFQLATSLIFDVLEGQRTRVVVVFDLGLRIRDRRTFPTSLHLSFR